MSQTFLPRQDVALVDGASRTTTPFYVFLQALEGRLLAAGVTRAEFDALVARVAALEAAGGDPTAQLQGIDSIRVFGSLADGFVQITLQGDTATPDPTYYYGTDADGQKGWFAVADTLAVEAGELTKAVGVDGVTTLGLADVADSGAGAALVKITRDAYGRVEGTEAAVLDDLSDVDAAAPSTGDALVFDGANWAPGQVATEQLFQRMTPEADFRITADGNLRVTT